MYHKVLVPLDGSKLAECVLPHVQSIVTGCGAASVVLLRAVPEGVAGGRGPTFFTDREWKEIEARSEAGAKEYLDRLAASLKWPGTTVQAVVVEGSPADVIAGYVEKNAIDLVVIATHGRSGISRIALGSVADRVLRAVSVPVLMVRPKECVAGA